MEDFLKKKLRASSRIICKQRREIRRLKSLLNAANRLALAQKTFFEEIEETRKADEKKIESTVIKCLKRILIDGVNTN